MRSDVASFVLMTLRWGNSCPEGRENSGEALVVATLLGGRSPRLVVMFAVRVDETEPERWEKTSIRQLQMYRGKAVATGFDD